MGVALRAEFGRVVRTFAARTADVADENSIFLAIPCIQQVTAVSAKDK